MNYRQYKHDNGGSSAACTDRCPACEQEKREIDRLLRKHHGTVPMSTIDHRRGPTPQKERTFAGR